MSPVAFGVLFGLAVFGGTSIERMERDMARELGGKVGGERKVVVVRANLGLESAWGVVPRVSVLASHFSCDALPFHAEPWRSHYGRVRRFQVFLHDFSLRKLHFDSMTATISNARFDLGYALKEHKFRISGSGGGPMTAVMKFDDMVRFAEAKYPQFKDVSISASGTDVEIKGSAELGPFKTAFKVKGVPAVRNGTQVYLTNAAVELNGKLLDEKAAAGFLKGFSTFMDLDRDLGAGGALEIDSFKVEADVLVCVGKVRIPEVASPPKSSSIKGDGIESPAKPVNKD